MEFTATSEAEMRALGHRIAAQLKGGELIELVGDVGAGKTTLTKGIARGLGVEEDVQSPSFTISRVYDLPDGRQLAHYDFYRLSDPGVLADELTEVMGRDDVITVIEWADIVESVLPPDHIQIQIISPTETTRQVTVRGVKL